MIKIVLTGGPCAGKTTALAKVNEYFSSLGYQVYCLPEIPTIFGKSGANLTTENKDYFFAIEQGILEMQLALENSFVSLATKQNKPSIIICDRGVMDISAYLNKKIWKKLIDEANLSEIQLRDASYNAVIHMTTAAKGAEQFYTTENNNQRSESLEQARILDDKLINAWTGHPHLRIVENNSSFEEKINKVISEISNVLGEPEPIEVERKYLVKLKAEIPNYTEVEIYQTYLLTNDDSEERVRKRGIDGSFIYYHTIKRQKTKEERVEIERQISSKEYMNLLQRKDANRVTIYKKRKVFVYKGQYFELDKYINPKLDFLTLELEGKKEHTDIIFPEFIEVLGDVTGDKKYSNYNLSKS